MTSLFHSPPGPRRIRMPRPARTQSTSLGSSPRYAPPSSPDEQYDEPYRKTADEEGEASYSSPHGRNSEAWYPFNENMIDTQPYEQTIVVLHHNRRGVRFYVQARTRIFFLFLGLLLVVLNLPGVSSVIGTLIRAILGGT